MEGESFIIKNDSSLSCGLHPRFLPIGIGAKQKGANFSRVYDLHL